MAAVSPADQAQTELPGIDVYVARRDQQRIVTYLTLGGVAAAAILAIIGGFPADMPMPTHAFGWVEPTCGLTRGSTAIARGDLALAWRYNPASFAVMGFGAYGITRFVIGTITRRWLTIRPHAGRYGWILIGAAFIALWAYQQQHADFIINSRL